MKPYELIRALVRGTGKSDRQVAIEMRDSTFQGTLYKFMAGGVASPQRATAERIARHFKLPIDALYDEAIATRVATERGIAAHEPPLVAREAEFYPLGRTPPQRLADDIVQRIEHLRPEQVRRLEVIIRAHLDALAEPG